MHSDASPSTRLTVLIGVVLLLILYGSLYPFRWNFDQPQPFVWTGTTSVADLVENVLLFMPLGALLGWSAQGRSYQAVRFVVWGLGALALASGLQWLQRYLPRTPALYDVVCNVAGYGLGWVGGVLLRARVGRLLEVHRRFGDAERFMLGLVVLWWLAELFPLIPTFDVSSLKENIKSLWQQPAWQPRRMAIHAGMTVIGLSAVVHLARSVHLAHRARQAAWVAAIAVLAGKFLVDGQSPGIAVVAGIAAGAVLWRLLDRSPPLQWTTLACAGLCTYLIYSLWPWAWRSAPVDMAWMPFASSLSTRVTFSFPTRALECLCFGALIWGATRHGAGLGRATLGTALLAFACEWTQRHLPTRTPEITPALLALAMGWLVWACAAPKRGPGQPDDAASAQRRIARTSSNTGSNPTATIATDGSAASASRSSRARL